MEGYYTAIIHTNTGTQYLNYDHLSDLYAHLNTLDYTYTDIYSSGVLIHHKTGPCVPTFAPHAPLMRRHIFARAAGWLRKKLFG